MFSISNQHIHNFQSMHVFNFTPCDSQLTILRQGYLSLSPLNELNISKKIIM